MNIGIDIRTLMNKEPSGVSGYTFNLIREIIKKDKKNKYKLFYNSFVDIEDVNDKIFKLHNKNVEIIKTNYPNKIFNFLMQKCFKSPKLDSLLGVDIFFIPNLGFISLSKKCKKILTIHDLSFLRYPEFFDLKRRLWHKIINIKKLINEMDVVVAVSKSTKNDIIKLCSIDENKVKVIYPGLDLDYKVLQNQNKGLCRIQKKYNLPKKFILYLGALEPRKNIRGIILSYNEFRCKNYDLSNYKLVIAGANGWKTRKIFKEWKKSKYKDDIIFLGYIDKKDKIYLYNLAKVFVFPSFYEGFGFPPLEAMACGTPVVASFSSSLREVIGSVAILIDPYNINEIRVAIENIIKDKDLCCKMIKQGLIKINDYKWEKAGKEYLNLFNM